MHPIHQTRFPHCACSSWPHTPGLGREPARVTWLRRAGLRAAGLKSARWPKEGSCKCKPLRAPGWTTWTDRKEGRKAKRRQSRGKRQRQLTSQWLSSCLNSMLRDSIKCPFIPMINSSSAYSATLKWISITCQQQQKRTLTKTTLKPCYQLLNISRIFLKTKTNFFLSIEYAVSKNVHMLLM